MLEVNRKLVVSGDADCGKTCLLLVHYNHSFPEGIVPSTFGNYLAEVEVDDVHVYMATIDMERHNPYDRLHLLAYLDSHAVVICFAIDDPKSLASVEETWIGEANHFAPGMPVILLGCKKDTRPAGNESIDERHDPARQFVTYEEGLAVANKVNANHYMECSAKTGEGVQEVFHYAARAALSVTPKKRRKSLIKRCIVL
ncbi:P-loop containing nucleoside triphosphate hydrolase protein [Cristinia sonorae]|uniref:P-loop containing nucleoside triphosphate hydrolase protein n=1 Tax=Cristinia sonorae TaxID=1940300 RepID=A0A8K0UG12_9AGAR|nr:P-loop containing nucleoside triphosphate hydrolase protein [Cristinia sonorae]